MANFGATFRTCSTAKVAVSPQARWQRLSLFLFFDVRQEFAALITEHQARRDAKVMETMFGGFFIFRHSQPRDNRVNFFPSLLANIHKLIYS